MRDQIRRPRLLVTGFGPFPNAAQNPTAELIDWLAGPSANLNRLEADIATAVFPTEWEELAGVHDRLMAEHEPDIAIHFGLHGRARAFHIEQFARNRKCARADARGRRSTPSPVLTGQPLLLRTPYPAERLVVHLQRRQLPARLSSDAGLYLCNMAYYLSLARVRDEIAPATALFIHVPPGTAGAASDSASQSASAQSRLRLRRCALAVIEHAVSELRSPAARQSA